MLSPLDSLSFYGSIKVGEMLPTESIWDHLNWEDKPLTEPWWPAWPNLNEENMLHYLQQERTQPRHPNTSTCHHIFLEDSEIIPETQFLLTSFGTLNWHQNSGSPVDMLRRCTVMIVFTCIYLFPYSQSISTNAQPSQSGLKLDFVHQ